jgi:hypothetical protein
MRLWLILAAVIITLLGLGAAAMPESFYTAMGRIPNIEVICVKNYEAGASITEAYGNFEYLDKETQMVSRTYDSREDRGVDCGEDCRERAILEASINSEVIGQAHLAWQSMDPIHENSVHHALIGRSVEDHTGVFSIEKFIQFWSNSTAANATSLHWLPCP